MRAASALRRLFSELADGDLERLEPTPFVIGRLLEEGDRSDLGWLCGAVEETALVSWLEARGSRQLSRRSRAFWSLLLSVPGHKPPENPLWPL